MKPDINPGKVYPQLIGNGHLVHLVDGALVGAGSLQQIFLRPGQLEPASGSVSCTCDVSQQPWRAPVVTMLWIRPLLVWNIPSSVGQFLE